MVQKTQKENDEKQPPVKPLALYQNYFSTHQQQLAEVIVSVAKPEIIFLLGASSYSTKAESIFTESEAALQGISHCCLLILMQEHCNRELHEWQNKIESRCSVFMPVTTIILRTTVFNDWLRTGHKFALTVWQSAPLIYDAGTIYMEYMFKNPWFNG